MVLATITVFMATALFLPGLVSSGDMEPPGPPGPTMKTLDEIPPTWSQKLDSTNGDASGCGSSRFECVLDGEAVLDKETGLVWERSPDTTEKTWISACSHCYDKLVGNRKGWRLPTAEELASLIDKDGDGTGKYLPNGHPFIGVQPWDYWSSTTTPDTPGSAWGIFFGGGSVGYVGKSDILNCYAWCVRGGHGHDAY